MKRRRNCGIYKILNQNNGKFYIGSAVSLSMRWREHVWQLSRGLHPNRHLQSAWKKHGEDAFVFVVLERIEDETRLVEREQSYLDELRSFVPTIGYNLSPTAGSTLGIPCSHEKASKIGHANRGKVRTEEHRAILRRYAGSSAHTPETGKKISEANIRRGSMTEEIWRKGCEARRGKPLAGKHSLAISIALQANTEHHEHLRALNAKIKGKSVKLTQEQIRTIRYLHSKGKHPNELAEMFNVSNTTIRNWCSRPDAEVANSGKPV